MPALLDYIYVIFMYLGLASVLYLFTVYFHINIYEWTIFYLSIIFGELSDLFGLPSIIFIWCHRSSEHKNPMTFDFFTNKQTLGIEGEIELKEKTTLFMDNGSKNPIKDKGKRPAAFSPTDEEVSREGSRWGSVSKPIEVSDGESDDSNRSGSSKGNTIKIEKEASSSVSNSDSSKSKRGPNLSISTGNNDPSNFASSSKKPTNGFGVHGTIVFNGIIVDPRDPNYLEVRARLEKSVMENNPNHNEMNFPLSKATQELVGFIRQSVGYSSLNPIYIVESPVAPSSTTQTGPGGIPFPTLGAEFDKLKEALSPNTRAKYEGDVTPGTLDKVWKIWVVTKTNSTAAPQYTAVVPQNTAALLENRKVYRGDPPYPVESESPGYRWNFDYDTSYAREHGYTPWDEKYKSIRYINVMNEKIKSNKNNDDDNNS